ncbi:hypothetical protein LY76DRAFT_351149 [Colletotrichum caudatum]|nr:hypothetical protein LY76DRAFT_351149 [Colletotrichum caudatum]
MFGIMYSSKERFHLEAPSDVKQPADDRHKIFVADSCEPAQTVLAGDGFRGSRPGKLPFGEPDGQDGGEQRRSWRLAGRCPPFHRADKDGANGCLAKSSSTTDGGGLPRWMIGCVMRGRLCTSGGEDQLSLRVDNTHRTLSRSAPYGSPVRFHFLTRRTSHARSEYHWAIKSAIFSRNRWG